MAELLKAMALFDPGIQFCLILLLIVFMGITSYTVISLTGIVMHEMSIWMNGWPPEHAFEEYEDDDADDADTYRYETRTERPDTEPPEKE
jgi:hypothetical protein